MFLSPPRPPPPSPPPPSAAPSAAPAPFFLPPMDLVRTVRCCRTYQSTSALFIASGASRCMYVGIAIYIESRFIKRESIIVLFHLMISLYVIQQFARSVHDDGRINLYFPSRRTIPSDKRRILSTLRTTDSSKHG